MSVPHEPKRARRNRLRFSLRTLLLVVLLGSAYFAGRAPVWRRAQHAERERDEYRRLAEQHEAELARMSGRASLRQYSLQILAPRDTTGRPSFMIPLSNDIHPTIDAGMMLDALEHQQQYLSSPQEGEWLR